MHGHENEETVWLFSTSISRLTPPLSTGRADELPYPGDRVEVCWPDDQKYHPGTVISKNGDAELDIPYDDGDLKELSFEEEVWRYIDENISTSNISAVSRARNSLEIAKRPQEDWSVVSTE